MGWRDASAQGEQSAGLTGRGSGEGVGVGVGVGEKVHLNAK